MSQQEEHRLKFGETIGYLDTFAYSDRRVLWSPGELVGKYQIQRLARASFYEALDTSTGKTVAVVTLPRATPPRNDRIPNVIRPFDGGRVGDTYFSVMDYIPGPTLADVIEKRELTALEAARITLALTRILDSIHRAGGVHRDLKPANIILGPKNQPFIVDYGIAKALEDASLTLVGEIMGAPLYMSPEQVQGKKQAIDLRTDIYSLGVILYQMLTFRVPFEGPNLPTVAYNIVHKEPSPPSVAMGGAIPTAFDAITMRAMSKSLDARYASAREMGRELDKFLGEGQTSGWSLIGWAAAAFKPKP